METAVDPGQVILDEVAALEVERARIEARIASKSLDFHDLRRRESESTDNPIRRDLEVSSLSMSWRWCCCSPPGWFSAAWPRPAGCGACCRARGWRSAPAASAPTGCR